MRLLYIYAYAILAVSLTACGSSSTPRAKCDAESTFGLVQNVFEVRGCNASTCHGAPASEAAGGLDLRPENAYTSLINVAAASADLPRVFPAEEEQSVLYLKVAAKTLGTDLASLGVTGSPMPSSPDQLTEDEVALIRAWIRGGAPATGFVEGSDEFAGCEADAEVTPNKIPPLPPPDAEKGIQFYSGGWSLPAESEDEVCYVTYYDFTDRVPAARQLPCPASYGGAERSCFAYDGLQHAQDPQSHHSIIESYIPAPENPHEWDPKNEVWRNWQCLGGSKAGAPCDPTAAGFCGERSTCATAPLTSIGCIAYSNGPPNLGSFLGFFGQEATRKNIAIAQEAAYAEDYPDGVYGVAPVKGFVVWNSHAFNLTMQDTTVEQYVNFTYIEQEDRLYQREDLTILDDIFAMGTVAPFTSQEACATFTLPIGSRLLTLSSHTHQYGRDFRIWYPPNDGCTAGPGCRPPEREPDYRSFFYQDPLYQRFDATNNLEILDSPDERDRTFRYCAIWDNGATDPMEVRRHSERPDATTCRFADFTDFLMGCGCEPELRACLGGPNQGMICGEDDSACGQGGVCDACPVWGGVTTEEEMFGVLGAYYVIE